MKVLFICGSPRKAGNTARILQNVASAVVGRHEAEICYISDYQINGCLGCNHCQQVLTEPGCVQRDDAAQILDKIIRADAVLYGTPLYGHSYSGQLKLLMDHRVALFKFVGGADKAVGEMEIQSFIAGKPVGLIVSCQGPEEDNTELVKMQFDKFCESSLSRCFGKYIFPWCSPDAEETKLSQTTLDAVVSDLDRLNRTGRIVAQERPLP